MPHLAERLLSSDGEAAWNDHIRRNAAGPRPSSRSARPAIHSPLMKAAPPPIRVNRAPVLTL